MNDVIKATTALAGITPATKTVGKASKPKGKTSPKTTKTQDDKTWEVTGKGSGNKFTVTRN